MVTQARSQQNSSDTSRTQKVSSQTWEDFNILEVKLRGAGPIQDVRSVLTSFKRLRLVRADDSPFRSTKRDRASVYICFGEILFLEALFIFDKRYGNRR